LKVIDVPFLPMVWFTTVSSGLPFVEKHPDIIDKMLRGICEGIAYFKTHRAESIKIIKDKYKAEGDLDDETATHLYDDLKKDPASEAVRDDSGDQQCLRNFHRAGQGRRERPIRWRCGIFTISDASTTAALSIIYIDVRPSCFDKLSTNGGFGFFFSVRPELVEGLRFSCTQSTEQQPMSNVTPQLGVKMSSNDARAYIDEVNKKVIQRWKERVTQGPFMSKFLEGTLPMSAIKLFFKNWGNFTVEINTLVSVSYHKHIGFFKRHPDLMAPLGVKIADEFIHPKPPGHVLVMLQTAEALGLTKDQVLREPMLPECRAILDFKRQLMWEGTVAEWWFSMLTEEPIGHWSALWFKTLTEKYGFQ
jgi:polyhydroxyalkanoate synthesis regulator phasin